jgi:NAD(P)-dependent dehydrogenase (short-subunit alcohol dehydrogenase family)
MTTMPDNVPKVFLITGVSSGFGREFATAALEAGHTVFGTVRNSKDAVAFESIARGKARAILHDVTDFESANRVAKDIIESVGHIDVLINNAGYGHEGALEESPMSELLRQFDVNVFGVVAMIKAVLPYMRQRRQGHIINMSSMAGVVPLAGIAYYAGSKFAIEGISGVLAKEVASFGVKVTAIAAGSFRTDWAGRSMVRTERSISDYDAIFDPIRKVREEKSGRQAGDPKRAAAVILKLIEVLNPPVHLVLGSDALSLIERKTEESMNELEAWAEWSISTDFK